jgi:hypothetical protein
MPLLCKTDASLPLPRKPSEMECWGDLGKCGRALLPPSRSPRSRYGLLRTLIQELAPGWRATSYVNLALLASAISQRRSLCLTGLLRTYPAPATRTVAQPKHGRLYRVKRLWRLLHHPALDVAVVPQRLLRLSATAYTAPDPWLPILVDLTYFTPSAILAASIPHGRRALPLAWRAFRRTLEGEGCLCQNQIIEGGLRALRGMITPGIRPVVVAGREPARAACFPVLKRQCAHCVISSCASPPRRGCGIRPLPPSGFPRSHWVTAGLPQPYAHSKYKKCYGGRGQQPWRRAPPRTGRCVRQPVDLVKCDRGWADPDEPPHGDTRDQQVVKLTEDWDEIRDDVQRHRQINEQPQQWQAGAQRHARTASQPPGEQEAMGHRQPHRLFDHLSRGRLGHDSAGADAGCAATLDAYPWLAAIVDG